MKLNLQQFNDIDFENIGGWPVQVKVVFAAVMGVLVLIFGYLFFLSSALEQYSAAQNKEADLRNDYKFKYTLASNLDVYRQQLNDMEVQFNTLLRMLPSQNEMPSLLDDLTFVATNAGLQIHSLDWQPQLNRDFYGEFPINMTVTGDYHQLGKLVSGVAQLPRIVSLHDFVIEESDDKLTMEIQARAYRFIEQPKLKGQGKK